MKDNYKFRFEVQFGIPPQAQEPKDLNAIRRLIDKTSWDCALTRNALNIAQREGMSGEDTYTLLAYYALLELHRLYKANMDWLMIQPLPTIIIDPKVP